MSHVEVAELKGINDTSIVWDTIPFNFTTGQVRHDFLTENNSYVRAFRILNRDSLNDLTYLYDSATGSPITVEPNSFDEKEGWISYIQVDPSVVSGLGTLEVDLVTRENAQKKLKRGQLGR